MTAKSIDWEQLSRQGTLLCPRYGPLPLSEDSARKTFNRGKFFAAQSALPCAVEPGIRAVPERPLRALPALHPSCSTSRCALSLRLLDGEPAGQDGGGSLPPAAGPVPRLIDPLYLGEG